VELCFNSSIMLSWRGAQLKHRGKFAFTFTLPPHVLKIHSPIYTNVFQVFFFSTQLSIT